MSTDRYKIGEFTLDVSQGCLRRGDIEIALRPKSFALLQHLITHAGRLVTKDELLSKIWPNVIVTEDSLTRCISEARAALGDSEQTAIKTVSKRGYIFAEPVTQVRRRCGRPTGGQYDPGGGTGLSKTTPNNPADRPRRSRACRGSLVRRDQGTAGHGTPAPVADRAAVCEPERRSGAGLSRRHHHQRIDDGAIAAARRDRDRRSAVHSRSRASRSTSSSWVPISTCDTRWRAACCAATDRCASTRGWSTPRP